MINSKALLNSQIGLVRIPGLHVKRCTGWDRYADFGMYRDIAWYFVQ